MAASTIIFVIAIAAAVLWGVIFGGRLPGAYGVRTCQGRDWRRAFPTAPKTQIREFLALFVEAFAFADKEKLKLRPDDKILSIYRTLYPSRWTPDALEVETLAKDINKKYGLSLASVWSEDLTLGQLFAKVREESNS
jgi:propanediol dehydratase small subunit